MLYLCLILLTFLAIQTKKILVNNNFLINNNGERHQNFSSKNKIPLTGGIYILLLIFLSVFQSLIEKNFLILLIIITFLGIFSDLKIIKSAKLRLYIQLIIILSFIIIENIQITETRINTLDYVINKHYVLNYLFVSFCLLILINGSNFIDGLNTLNIGYFLSILTCLIILDHNNRLVFNVYSLNLKFIFMILIFSYFLNFKNIFFLGDSGAYLLGVFFSIILIKIYQLNPYISPFFIILLLWYPSYELLFSMIRKKILNRSLMKPDNNHFHQLFFYWIKKKFKKKIFLANLISSNFINFYNLLIFLISLNYLQNTQVQILLILLNLIVYTVTYFRLFIYRYKKI
jgi:UDP-N-acetylmuramyl pentapeptide phosphotransferase/UDP-N-acetylglucosamine-1-phosphate transferase